MRVAIWVGTSENLVFILVVKSAEVLGRSGALERRRMDPQEEASQNSGLQV